MLGTAAYVLRFGSVGGNHRTRSYSKPVLQRSRPCGQPSSARSFGDRRSEIEVFCCYHSGLNINVLSLRFCHRFHMRKVLSLKTLHVSALRMQEMVSMGIGSKPFMDIKPSDAAISDRAIDYIMKGSGELSFALYLCSSPSFCPPHPTLFHLHRSPCGHADMCASSFLRNSYTNSE